LSKNIAESKKDYNNNLIRHSKNKIAIIWKIIKSETGKTYIRDSTTKMDVNGTMTCNPQITSDSMNQYFLSIADNIVHGISTVTYNTAINSPVDYLLQTFIKPFPAIKYNNIMRHEIEKIIKSLKSSNSCSYDEISVKILKLSCSYLSSPFNKLRNTTLSTGICPDYLKYSEIKPSFKSGNKDKMDSYKPTSVLPSLSKIFKELTLHRLGQHFNDHHIIANKQSGFRQNYSTDKVTFYPLNQILNALNTTKTVGGIFCNLKKALDYVDRVILLTKLKFYGITGRMYDLIKSYLQDRYQQVVIHSNCAQNIIQSGVKCPRVSHSDPSLDHSFFWCISMIYVYF
jgi:hypothetical protein